MGNYHHRRRRRFLWCLLTASILLDSIGCGRGEVTREFEISEGVPVGTSIGFIGEQISGSFQPPPPYLIVPVPGSSVDSDLIIDQSNGEIRTRIPLDRETRDLYSLVAIPISGENIRVIIRVKDENDHAPQFPSQYMSVEFPENTPGDVKRTLQPARDKDLGIYNTQRYRISSGNVNNAFRLSSHRERDGVLYLDLQVNGFLDRETIPFYNLFIDAFDGGVPPLKGSMTVNVTIQDVNDNQPIFNQSRYFASVPENATVGTSVLQVCATDTDAGPNGQIFYSINRRQTDRDSIFVIDKDTGVISVNRPLDFESKEVHELVVVAKDNGVQPLETTVFVSISVIDVNDNQVKKSLFASPKFQKPFFRLLPNFKSSAGCLLLKTVLSLTKNVNHHSTYALPPFYSLHEFRNSRPNFTTFMSYIRKSVGRLRFSRVIFVESKFVRVAEFFTATTNLFLRPAEFVPHCDFVMT